MGPDPRTESLHRLLLQASVLATVTFAVMAASVWGLKRISERHHNLQSARLTQWVQTHGQEFIDQHLQGLNTLTNLYVASEEISLEKFDSTAAEIIQKNSSFLALNYVNRDMIIQNVYPLASNRSALRLDLKSRFDVLPVAHRAIAERRVTTTDLLDLVQGGKGILLYEPIVREDRWAGLIEGVLKLDEFCQEFLGKRIGPDHDYTIVDETTGQEVYTSLKPTAFERSTPYDTYFTLRFGDRNWWVVLHPKSPPFLLLPLVLVLILELCLGVLALYSLWRREGFLS